MAPKLQLANIQSLGQLSKYLHELGYLTIDDGGTAKLVEKPRPLLIDCTSQGATRFGKRGPTPRVYLPYSLSILSCSLLLARECASRQCSTTIRFPRPDGIRESRGLRAFRQLDVLSLFGEEQGEWTQYVSLDYKPAKRIEPLDDIKQTTDPTFLPLTWITASFYPGFRIQDRHRHQYLLEHRQRGKLQYMLRDLGGLSYETSELVTRTVLDELCQNVLLHSGYADELPVGLLGAEVHTDERASHRSILVHVSDLGQTFPRALSKPGGESNLPDSTKRRYTYQALAERRSSRPEFPNNSYEDSNRGLRMVLESLPLGSYFSLSTDSVSITLRAEDGFQQHHTEELRGRPIAGAHHLVFFKEARDSQDTVGESVVHTRQIACIATGVTSSGEQLQPSQILEQLESSSRDQESWVVVDFGFADDRRQVASTLLHVGKQVSGRYHLMAWNVVTAKSLVESDIKALARTFDVLFLEFSLADSSGLVTSYSLNDKINSNTPELLRIGTSNLSPNLVTQLHWACNSRYIERGFSGQNNKAGFFLGTIYGASATSPLKNYFSLRLNIGQPSTSNLLRWKHSLHNIIKSILEKYSHQSLSMVTAGDGVEMILEKALQDESRVDEFVTLTSNELPSREAWQKQFTSGDRLCLIVDVLSSGSAVSAILELARKTRTEVVAIVAIAHRVSSDNTLDARWRTAWPQCQFYRLSTIGPFSQQETERTSNKQAELPLESVRWTLDPVSRTPVKRGIDTKRTPDNFRESLKVFEQSPAVNCGRNTVQSRSTSVFVNTALFVQVHRAWLRQHTKKLIVEKLSGVGWESFNPGLFVYPASTDWLRKRRVGASGGHFTSGLSGARLFTELVDRIFQARDPASTVQMEDGSSSHARIVEVPREFDPMGVGRCSYGELWCAGTTSTDVVVADDGFWTGATFEAMARELNRFYVRRILFIPLITRVSMERYLELSDAIRSISTASGTTDILYVLPLLLPVPYYSTTENPYELTESRLNQYRKLPGSIGIATTRVVDQLRTGNRELNSSDRYEFRRTWVRARVSAELGQTDHVQLSDLTKSINETTNPAALDAIFNLFVDEWQLMRRDKLRKTLGHVVTNKCLHVIEDGSYSSQVVESALTFLRSHYLDDFLSVLRYFSGTDDLKLLERISLHIASLDSEIMNSDDVRYFVSEVASRLQKDESEKVSKSQDSAFKEIGEAFQHIYSRLQTERWDGLSIGDALLSLKSEYERGEASWALTHLSTDMKTLSGRRPNRTNDERWTEALSNWPDISTAITHRLLPLFRYFEGFFPFMDDPRQPWKGSWWGYFSEHVTDREEHLRLRYDMSLLDSAATGLAEGRSVTTPKTAIEAAAGRIYDAVVGTSCKLYTFLVKDCVVTLDTLLEELSVTIEKAEYGEGGIERQLPSGSVKIYKDKVSEGISAIVPRDTIAKLGMVLGKNVVQHALRRTDSTNTLRVELVVQPALGTTQNKSVILEVRDNGMGPPLGTRWRSTKRLANDLQQIGIRMMPPEPSIVGTGATVRIMFCTTDVGSVNNNEE